MFCEKLKITQLVTMTFQILKIENIQEKFLNKQIEKEQLFVIKTHLLCMGQNKMLFISEFMIEK